MTRDVTKRGGRFKLGDHWMTDDRTGIAHYASDTIRQWDGLIVKRGSEETRHPQEYVRPLPADPFAPQLIVPEQGTNFDDICGFYRMEFVPGTVTRRTYSITDDLLPLPGVGQMALGTAANDCGHWFVVQEPQISEVVYPGIDGTATSFNIATRSPIVTIPSNATTGNWVIIISTSENEVNYTWPTGWTELITIKNSTVSISSAYRDLDGTESFAMSPVKTLTIDIDSKESVANISYSLFNFESTVPPEVSIGNTGTNINPDPDVITPSSGDEDYLIFAVEAHNSGSTDTTVFPANYTNEQESNSP